MARLKDLQEMAKNGKVSEELLKDEEFKSKLKEALKKGIGKEITNEQISEIIKNFEIALQDKELLKDAELEIISGGSAKASAIKYSCAILGAALSGTGGYAIGGIAGNFLDNLFIPITEIQITNIKNGRVTTRTECSPDPIFPNHPHLFRNVNRGLGVITGIWYGWTSGWSYGETLCEKWKIEDKKAKK